METDPMKRSRFIRIAGKLWRPLRNAAAILMTLIVLSAGMTAWTNSQTAHAMKFRIEKRFQKKVLSAFRMNVGGLFRIVEDC